MTGKIIHRRNEELLIRLHAADQQGLWRVMTFEKPRIDYLVEVNDEMSAIVLLSGLKFAVGLPLGVLEQKIYQPDSDILDLRDVTGSAAEVPVPVLKSAGETKSLEIRALLRRNQSDETKIFTFSENDIKSFELDPATRSQTGESVKVSFNANANKPFGGNLAMIDMPYAEYARYLVEAKEKNLARLDLVDAFLRNPLRYGRRT